MKKNAAATADLDYTLLVLIIGLQLFGLVMLFSASYSQSFYAYAGNFTTLILKQVLWVALGLGAMSITINIDYHSWQKLSLPLTMLTLAVLALVLAVADPIYGARQSFRLGPMNLQPSEFAKISITIYIAYWLSSKGERIRDINYGLIPFALLLGLLVSLIIVEPDLSTSLVIIMAAMIMFFIAGADIIQIGTVFGLFVLVAILAVNIFSYAQDRISRFISGFSDPFNITDPQIRHGVQFIYDGGWFGNGLASAGLDATNQLYLPHSDSIFAVIGKELGFVGALLVIFCFLFFAFRGLKVAMAASDAFGTLLAVGITSWIAGQALIHIAVATATFPNTGLPLPFFSYGGSSTLANFIALGILLNISRNGRGGFSLDPNSRIWGRNRRPRVSNTGRRQSPRRKGATSYARNRR